MNQQVDTRNPENGRPKPNHQGTDLKKRNSKLAVGSGFLSFVAILLLTAIVVATLVDRKLEPSKNMKTLFFSKNYDVCSSPDCLNMTKYLQSIVNLSADPCNDFFTFVCGNFKKTYGPNQRMSMIKSEAGNKLLKMGLKSLDRRKRSIVKFAKMFYHRCFADNVQVHKEMETLRQIFQEVGGVPLFDRGTYNKSVPWWKRQLILLTDLSDLAFSLGILLNVVDANHQLHITIPQKNTFLIPAIVQNNQPLWNNVTKQHAKAYVNIICGLIQKSCTQEHKDNLEMKLGEIFKFDSELYLLSKSPDLQSLTKTTLSKLQNDFPSVPWFKFLNALWRNFQTKNIEIAIHEDYYKIVFNKYKRTDSLLLANYMGLVLLKKFLPFALKGDSKYEMESIVGKINRESICQGILVEAFPEVVDRIFVEEVFKTHHQLKDNTEVSSVIRNTRKGFVVAIDETKWLDHKTKKLVKEKFLEINFRIGFQRSIMNNRVVNQMFHMNMKKVNNSTLTGLLVEVLKHMNTNSRLKVTSVDKWPLRVYTVDAAYKLMSNILYIPISQFLPPSYWPNGIKSAKYGVLGSGVGHELGHAIDMTGSNFDKYGNQMDMTRLWSTSSYTNFVNRQQCLAVQYTKAFQENNIDLHGNTTVGEDMNDVSGLRAAYYGYLLSGPQDQRLPGFEQLNDRQLFFIFAASKFCSSFESIINPVSNSMHTPEKLRVFMPHSNLEEFSEAFQCPTGSFMNRRDKCVVWQFY